MRTVLRFSAYLLCFVFIAGCGQKQAPAPAGVPVNLLTVKAQPVTYYDRYTATTVALSQVNLLPEVQGYITGIFFREGTHVRKGDKLYEIDRRIYEDNYNAAEANLKVAEGTLKQARQDAERYEYLNKNNAVAKQLYDHAIITLQNSQNAYAAAEQALKNAGTNLAYSVITAPFDGTIGFSQVKLGDLMSVGQTVLNTISSDDPMGVDFLINEKQLATFEQLQKDGVPRVDSLFTLILPDNSLYPYQGKLSVIDRAVNPQTGSLRIRLVFPNPSSALRAGMSCVVRVHNQEKTPQIVIPSQAVVEEMGEYFVYTARDTTVTPQGSAVPDPGLFAFQRKVQTGVQIGPSIIIRSGIGEGEKIVVDGIQTLHNGSRINPSDRRPQETRDNDNAGPRAGTKKPA
ncbi:MAG TPA: efflux RND transporter periplasmic adaptor subunit [Bacteroidota bacterium]|nr:efflux RND transporter periplasmic adaptor subunit [Bacteroidota bacterium]